MTVRAVTIEAEHILLGDHMEEGLAVVAYTLYRDGHMTVELATSRLSALPDGRLEPVHANGITRTYQRSDPVTVIRNDVLGARAQLQVRSLTDEPVEAFRTYVESIQISYGPRTPDHGPRTML